MTVKYIYAGANQTDTSARIKGPVQSITTHADGTFGTSTWSILDPTGTLNYLHLKEWAVEEDAATPVRAFTGRAFDHRISRGPYLTGPGRQIEFDVDDLNGYLHLQPLRGASSNRPRETRSARMAWLLSAATGLDGLVFDNGAINVDSAMLDETDYRTQYPDAVLTDMCLTTRIFFVYWDHAAGQPSLFFDLPTATTSTSTLSLSNVASDCGAIDDPATTCYPVHPDPTLDTGASLVYCGIDLVYRNGRIYRHDATTHALYFGATAVHRVAVVTSDRIGLLSTAESRAAAFLANSRYPQAKVTVTVKLPAAKLNLIEAGMRISIRLQHMAPEGFDPAIYSRVTSKTWPKESTDGYYDVTLELSNRAITGAGGGGDPGGFPYQTNCDLAYNNNFALNVSTSPGTITLPSAPTVGNTLVFVFAGRTTSTGSFPPATGTWTLIDEQDQGVAGAATCGVYYRVVEAGDTAVWTLALATSDRGLMFELEGTLAFDVKNKALIPPLNNPTVALTPTAGKKAILISAATGNFNVGTPYPLEPDPATGMTLIYGGATAQGVPWMGVNFRIVDNTSGSYTVGSTGTSQPFENQNIVAASFTCDAADTPPSPGQWTYNELVTLTAGAGTTQNPFADGSLRVRYDIIDQTPAIVSYDGATGGFVMPSQPPLGTQVFVDYQGR